MTEYPKTETVIFLAIFSLIYLNLLLRRVLRHELDIYDFVLLSSCGLVPVGFAVFPNVAFFLASVVGVKFPFLLIFGSLLFILFFYLFITTRRVNRLERKLFRLIQQHAIDVAKLREEMK